MPPCEHLVWDDPYNIAEVWDNIEEGQAEYQPFLFWQQGEPNLS